MNNRSRIKLGVSAITAVALVVAALGIFADLDWWRPRDHYLVRFDRSVSGLGAGARVNLWGVPIGSVESIALEPRSKAPVVVTLAVERGTRIPAGAKAQLSVEGLTEVKFVNVVGGNMSGPFLHDGDTIASSDRGLSQALEQAEDVAARLDHVMSRLQQTADNLAALTGPDNQRRVASILQRADQTAAAAASAGKDVEQVAADLRRRVPAIVDAAARSSDDLRAAMREARGTASELHGAATDLGAAARGGAAELRSVLLQLRGAAQGARDLVRSLQDDPARLLRGREPRERRTP